MNRNKNTYDLFAKMSLPHTSAAGEASSQHPTRCDLIDSLGLNATSASFISVGRSTKIIESDSNSLPHRIRRHRIKLLQCC